ncbi:Ryncolin-2,Ryncolin-4,Ficolin-2,Ryncolin-1,Ryncolin-3,Fibrinogen C domain-containing protein 1 [Mytilus coruscus]|uniref:Ryncolin-2,Ryncolin-4,Ficolin-2,Ryncolin-1,Ryncol in-3,Fibrinogen C domain-containing protein 1 n=1 Tax=Mytilus coruscus TaxID=42192 RepID=A0A6J8D9Y8_MYTCO|nr:Ryncolin-2,Ryncolin-4,Ficolin-2,Ryncolin-1,Ryncolin-3,Fibrinogen C domain-containing protein 1 [Mytilus coruscus]
MDFLLAFYPVILLVLTFVGAFLEDVCDQNDYECQHPYDITVMGHLQHRKSQQTNILRRIRQLSLLKCVKECFMTSQCTAINYRQNWDLCDVVGEITDGALVEEDGCIFSKISTWPKSFAGICTDHNCAAGQKCVKDDNGGYTCMIAYCDDLLPDIYEAVSIETFGLYKNLGTGNKFKCNEGFALVGRPFAVCTDYGKWKIMFYCIEQALYPPHDCADIPRRCGSGVYRIHPTTSAKFNVYCEMDTDNGGWTTVMICLPDIYEAVSIETFGLYKNLGTGNKFKCNEGFALVGRPFAVCTDYGKWKIIFYCIEQDCDDLLPDIYEAVSIETFGLYKNLGTGNKFKCNEGFALVGRPFAVCTDYGKWKIMFYCIEQALYPPHDCADIPRRCGSGVYRIHPTTSAKFNVYCEMDTDNGGWTVLTIHLLLAYEQNATPLYPPHDCADIPRRCGSGVYRIHPTTSAKFNVYCEMDTDNGGWTVICNVTGNAKIHKIVSSGDYQLRVDLEDFEGNAVWAKSTKFYIGDVTTNYKLEISGYVASSTAGDSLTYHTENMFSTHDRDNDKYPNSCAVNFKGAWWYQNCHHSNLNGAYLSGGMDSYADGVIWTKWKGYYYSLKSTKLMIKKL